MSEREQLSEVCVRLGATRAQAETMAGQLLKRAEQLAGDRGSTREAELARLLQIVIQGRAGEVSPGFSRSSAPSAE